MKVTYPMQGLWEDDSDGRKLIRSFCRADKITQTELTLFSRPFQHLMRPILFYRGLRRFLALIETNYASTLDLERAAAHCGMSPRHFNRRLRETTGMSFHQFLTRYRLWRVVELMVETDFNLLEIALATGFGSMSSFYRHFRKVLAVPPRDFRADLVSGRRSGPETMRNHIDDFPERSAHPTSRALES